MTFFKVGVSSFAANPHEAADYLASHHCLASAVSLVTTISSQYSSDNGNIFMLSGSKHIKTILLHCVGRNSRSPGAQACHPSACLAGLVKT